MTAEILDLQKRAEQIDPEDLGNEILQEIHSDECPPEDIGEGILFALDGCETDRELRMIEATLTALTGYGIKTYVRRLTN